MSRRGPPGKVPASDEMQFEEAGAEDQMMWIHPIFVLFVEYLVCDSHFKDIILFNPYDTYKEGIYQSLRKTQTLKIRDVK